MNHNGRLSLRRELIYRRIPHELQKREVAFLTR